MQKCGSRREAKFGANSEEVEQVEFGDRCKKQRSNQSVPICESAEAGVLRPSGAMNLSGLIWKTQIPSPFTRMDRELGFPKQVFMYIPVVSR